MQHTSRQWREFHLRFRCGGPGTEPSLDTPKLPAGDGRDDGRLADGRPGVPSVKPFAFWCSHPLLL